MQSKEEPCVVIKGWAGMSVQLWNATQGMKDLQHGVHHTTKELRGGYRGGQGMSDTHEFQNHVLLGASGWISYNTFTSPVFQITFCQCNQLKGWIPLT